MDFWGGSLSTFRALEPGFWGACGGVGWGHHLTQMPGPHVTKHPPVPAGDPLQCGAWVGQCALYIVIMIFEKSVVFIVLLILQWKKVCFVPALAAPCHAEQAALPPHHPHTPTLRKPNFCFNSMNVSWIWSDVATTPKSLSILSIHPL